MADARLHTFWLAYSRCDMGPPQGVCISFQMLPPVLVEVMSFWWDPGVNLVSFWVNNQQAAELYGVLAAVETAEQQRYGRMQLILDKLRALFQILHG